MSSIRAITALSRTGLRTQTQNIARTAEGKPDSFANFDFKSKRNTLSCPSPIVCLSLPSRQVGACSTWALRFVACTRDGGRVGRGYHQARHDYLGSQANTSRCSILLIFNAVASTSTLVHTHGCYRAGSELDSVQCSACAFLAHNELRVPAYLQCAAGVPHRLREHPYVPHQTQS